MSIRTVVRSILHTYGFSALFIVASLLLWELFVWQTATPDYILPAPSRVLARLFRSMPMLLDHASVTLLEALLGFLLGASAGTTFALLMARSHVIERMLYPLVISSQTFPKEALAPVFVVWFGFGLLPKVVIAALISFFPGCRQHDTWFALRRPHHPGSYEVPLRESSPGLHKSQAAQCRALPLCCSKDVHHPQRHRGRRRRVCRSQRRARPPRAPGECGARD